MALESECATSTGCKAKAFKIPNDQLMEGEDKLEESAERISEFMEDVPEDLVEIA